MFLGFGIRTCVVFLSPTVLSYRTSLSSFVVLSMACVMCESLVFHPSRCELIVVRIDAMV
jgi:hypothetical protein